MTPRFMFWTGLTTAIFGTIFLSITHAHMETWGVTAGAVSLVSSGYLIGRFIDEM